MQEAYELEGELDLLFTAVGLDMDAKDRKILGHRLGAKYGLTRKSQQDVASHVGMSQPGISNREQDLKERMRRVRRRIEAKAADKAPRSPTNSSLLNTPCKNSGNCSEMTDFVSCN